MVSGEGMIFFVLSPMTTGRVVFPGPTSAEVVAQVLEAVAELRSTWLESDFSRLFNWGGYHLWVTHSNTSRSMVGLGQGGGVISLVGFPIHRGPENSHPALRCQRKWALRRWVTVEPWTPLPRACAAQSHGHTQNRLENRYYPLVN